MKSHWIDHDGSERAPVATRDLLDVIWSRKGVEAGLTLQTIDWREVVSYRVYEPSDDRDLIGYAQRVATVAANKAGCDESWRPLNDLSGCLMQIDNAMTGLVAKPDFMDSPRGWLIKDQFDADPEAWFYTNHEDQAREYAQDGTPVFALPSFALQPNPRQQGGAELRDAADALVNGFAWSAVRPDCEEARSHLQSLIDRLRAALSPAPEAGEEGWTGRKCPTCNGTGERSADPMGPCPDCGGTGDEWAALSSTRSAGGKVEPVEEVCFCCGGSPCKRIAQPARMPTLDRHAIKAAISYAMQDERDGKPCGCIVEAGCEARGYDDPGYAASGFLDEATENVIQALRPQSTEAAEALFHTGETKGNGRG